MMRRFCGGASRDTVSDATRPLAIKHPVYQTGSTLTGLQQPRCFHRGCRTRRTERKWRSTERTVRKWQALPQEPESTKTNAESSLTAFTLLLPPLRALSAAPDALQLLCRRRQPVTEHQFNGASVQNVVTFHRT